jgi:hypothetical protein
MSDMTKAAGFSQQLATRLIPITMRNLINAGVGTINRYGWLKNITRKEKA